MIRTLRLWIAAPAILLTFAAAALGDTVWDVVNLVDQTSYTNYLSTDDFLYTNSGDNRGVSGPQHDPARTNIFNTLAGFGLTTTLDPFVYNSTTYYNVVAIHPGLVHPEQIYIVGAHYDSVSNPGADDDASGVAGVLEAARVLSQYDLESTLVFIAFDREEQGLKGSSAYATAHSGDDIRGMVQLDMIGYSPGTDDDKARLYVSQTNSQSLAVRAALSQALLDYGGVTSTLGAMGQSDHVPFAADGSVLLIEYYWSGNPNYHDPTDSVDTAGYIDYAYATDMTRGVVGYLATAAALYEVTLVPEPASSVLFGGGAVVVLLLVRRRLGVAAR